MTKTTYLIRRTVSGTSRWERVDATTPQAAARKVFGRRVSFGPERESMAGAIRALEVATNTATGEVQWANQPNIALVRHAHRPESAPFFTDPDAWIDGERYPLTVLA